MLQFPIYHMRSANKSMVLTLGVVFGKEMEKLLKVVVFLFNKSWFAVVAILNASIVTLNFYHHIFLGEFNGL